MTEEAVGGRVFFSSTGRSLVDEDEIVVLSVGVDIGSSTSHLVFSRIVLERLDSRYVVTQRETFYQSDILLTPYSDAGEETIDAEALGAFIERQYQDAKVDPDEIDTGALILTGVAVRRRNARKIGELFARQAGKMVAVSAGDNLETVMAAYGSGAVARSIRDKAVVMNVDIGGGTSKIAVCADGKVVDLTAVDVGARLVCIDDSRPHRAGRGGWPAVCRRTRHRRRARRARSRRTTRARWRRAWPSGCSRRCSGGVADRGGARPRAGSIRSRTAAPIKRGDLFRRRIGIHLWPRSRHASAISAPCWRRKSARASRAGARRSSARTRASAPPSWGPRNTPRR